jgi:hypothetical protein
VPHKIHTTGHQIGLTGHGRPHRSLKLARQAINRPITAECCGTGVQQEPAPASPRQWRRRRRTMRKGPGLALTVALGRRGQVVEHDGQRQEGHEELERSELSTHTTWNPCPHCGITHTSSRLPNCARKTMHSASSSSAALRHHAHLHTPLRLPPPRPRKSASAAPCTFFVSPSVGVALLRLRSRRRLGARCCWSAPQRRLGCSWGAMVCLRRPRRSCCAGSECNGRQQRVPRRDERVEHGGGAARMTTTLELMPEGNGPKPAKWINLLSVAGASIAKSCRGFTTPIARQWSCGWAGTNPMGWELFLLSGCVSADDVAVFLFFV